MKSKFEQWWELRGCHDTGFSVPEHYAKIIWEAATALALSELEHCANDHGRPGAVIKQIKEGK